MTTYEAAPPPTSVSAGVQDARARYRRRPDALWRRTPRGIVLLPMDAPNPVELRDGTALWELLAELTTIEEIVAALAARFGAAAEDIRADVGASIDNLVRLRAVEAHRSSAHLNGHHHEH